MFIIKFMFVSIILLSFNNENEVSGGYGHDAFMKIRKIFAKKNTQKNCICGKTDHHTDYIIGGYLANEDRYPWMVRLLITRANGETIGCGGTIITSRHVLTAAHCTLNHTSILVEKRGEVFQIKNVLNNPRYDHKRYTYVNDISLLTLQEKLKFNSTFTPVCLESLRDGKDKYRSRQVMTMGWGKSGKNKTKGLMAVNITSLDFNGKIIKF